VSPRILAPGDTFGKYSIVRPIGSGGMAAVYEATYVNLHKQVALKVLHSWLALRLDVVQRFVLEARAASRFAHPHVVAISDIDSLDGVPFMAMDLLVGEQLAEVLDRGGPLPLERLADVMLPVLSAVAAAHDAGVLHRDLKPENIFLKQLQRREHPVLLDFGISKFMTGGPAQPLTANGEVLGTPPYMSPEQVLHGMGNFDARSDQYALGVVLYECATGKLPFHDFVSIEALMVAITKGGAPPPSALRPGLPPAFDAIVGRAMSLAPEERFPSVVELGAALYPFAGDRARALWSDDFGSPDVPRSIPRHQSVGVPPAELRALPLFDGVPDAEIARLEALAPAHRFAGGTALFDQGGTGSSCFVLVSGSVEIFRTHGADTWKIATISPGAVLGLSSLWEDVTRPVAAVAAGDCVAIQIKRTALAPLDTECPTVADRLTDEAASLAVRRLHDTTDRVNDLDRSSQETSRDQLVRLAAAIGEWSVPLLRRASGGKTGER
jgi:serine/threonine-protein kinase